MYVFAGLRFIFFFIQLAVFVLIAFQNTFCVNHKPEKFENLSTICEASLLSVIAVDHRSSLVAEVHDADSQEIRKRDIGVPTSGAKVAIKERDFQRNKKDIHLESFYRGSEIEIPTSSSESSSTKAKATSTPATVTTIKTNDQDSTTALATTTTTSQTETTPSPKSSSVKDTTVKVVLQSSPSAPLQTRKPTKKLEVFEATTTSKAKTQKAVLTTSSLPKVSKKIKEPMVLYQNPPTTTPEPPNDRWYSMDFQDEEIRINTRTCFNFHFYLAFTGNDTDFGDTVLQIMSPMKLNLIFIVSSFLLAFLSVILRIVAMKKSSWIHTILHSTIQLAIWVTILIKFEIFRQSWSGVWFDYGTPFYPREWLIAEILCFVIIAISASDVLLFKYSDYKLKFEKSQGVYKCIEMQETDVNGTFRSIPTDED